jgi:hypothetical protein
MDKPTKKNKKYNAVILNVLQEKYGFGIDYIRKALRGDRVGEMPDVLKKEYEALDNAAKTAIKENSNSLKPTI